MPKSLQLISLDDKIMIFIFCYVLMCLAIFLQLKPELYNPFFHNSEIQETLSCFYENVFS